METAFWWSTSTLLLPRAMDVYAGEAVVLGLFFPSLPRAANIAVVQSEPPALERGPWPCDNRRCVWPHG